MVNKETIKYISIAVIICLIEFMISITKPYAVSGLFRSFIGAFGVVIFLALLFSFTIVVLLGKKNIEKRVFDKYAFRVISIAFAISFLVSLLKGNEVGGCIDLIVPENNRTTLTMVKDVENKDLYETLLLAYYFKDKALLFDQGYKDCLNDKNMLAVIEKGFINKEQLIIKDDDRLVETLSYEGVASFEWNGYTFLVDSEWYKTKFIRYKELGAKKIFASEEYFNNATKPTMNAEFVNDAREEMIAQMSADTNKNKIIQILVLFLLSSLGALLAAVFWGGKNPGLLICSGLPISVFMWCSSCMLFIFTRVKANAWNICLCMVLLSGATIFMGRKRIKEICVINMIKALSIWLCVIVTLVIFGMGYTSYDSICKILLGLRFEQTGYLIDVIGKTYSFGFIDPLMMTVGFLFGGDYFYAFYPLMSIGILGAMLFGFALQNPREELKKIMLLAVVLLLINVDFIVNGFTVWTHISLAMYFLMVGLIVFMDTKKLVSRTDAAIIICFFMIMISRTEGAIYIILFSLLLLGIENESFSAKRIVRGTGILIIIWNAILLSAMGWNYSSNFYSSERGEILLVLASLMLLVNECLHTKNAFFQWIKQHITQILTLGLFCIALLLTFTIKRPIASESFPVFLLHFTGRGVSDSNNGGIWLFIFVIVALLLCEKKKLSMYAVSMIICYILSLYILCLLRTDGVTRVGLSDSFRRLLMQIMPFGIWMTISVFSEMMNGIAYEKE